MSESFIKKVNEEFERALHLVIDNDFISEIKLSPKGETKITVGVAISVCNEVYIKTSNDKTWQGVIALLELLKNDLRAAGYQVDVKSEPQPIVEDEVCPDPVIHKAPELSPDTVSGGEHKPKKKSKKSKYISKPKEE